MTSSSEDFHFGNLKDLFEKIKSPGTCLCRCVSRGFPNATALEKACARPGVFACGFEDATAVFPGLEVDGLGFLSLPLGPEQAKQLQQLCGPAPFGRGQKTLYDPKVRKTSQLAPEKLTFHNPGLLYVLIACIVCPGKQRPHRGTPVSLAHLGLAVETVQVHFTLL